MRMHEPRVLLVEDDALRDAVSSALRSDGNTLHVEPDGTRVRQRAERFRPDLALLDVRLPQGPSGLSIARILRETDPDLPIISLTAADATDDRLAGSPRAARW